MFQDVIDIIRSRDDFAITSHVRPDGDALGSELALLLSLEALGKKALVINRDPVPDRYRSLPGAERVTTGSCIPESHSAVFVLECGSSERTGLCNLDRHTLVNIDHHHSTSRYAAV